MKKKLWTQLSGRGTRIGGNHHHQTVGFNWPDWSCFWFSDHQWLHWHMMWEIGCYHSPFGIFPSTFLQPVSCSKNSILNWVMKINLFHLTLLVNFFFETPHKTLKFQEKITATVDKWYTRYASVVKKSVGNAFSSKLDTYISKNFALIPTMEKPHRDSELSKQQRIIEEKWLKTKVLGWKPARS